MRGRGRRRSWKVRVDAWVGEQRDGGTKTGERVFGGRWTVKYRSRGKCCTDNFFRFTVSALSIIPERLAVGSPGGLSP